MNPPPETAEAAGRTALAWRRTVLSSVVVALLAARPAITGDPRPVTVAALAFGGCGVLVVLARQRRRLRPARHAPLVAGIVVLGYALLGVAAVL